MPGMSFRLLAIIFGLLLFGELVERNILFPRFNKNHAEKVQKIFAKKEKQLLEYMDMAANCVDQSQEESCLIDLHHKFEQKMNKQGMFLFVYQNDSLTYWSTKDVPVAPRFSKSNLSNRYVHLNNGRYISFVIHQDKCEIVGLLLIKQVYIYENQYLQPAFQKAFNLPANVKIYPGPMEGSFPITDHNQQFVFSLIFDSTCFYLYQIYLPAIAYFLVILVFFVLIDNVFQKVKSPLHKNIYLPVLAIVLIGVRALMQYWHFPGVFYQLPFFDARHFASQWFSSLGDLALWILFISFFIFELCRNLRFPIYYEQRWKYFANIGVLLAATILGFFGIHVLLKALVINSHDLFEMPSRSLSFSGYSILGHSIIIMIMLAFCLLLNKALLLCKHELNFRQFAIFYVITLSIVIIGWSLFGMSISLSAIFILSLVVYILATVHLNKSGKIKYSHYAMIVFVLAAYVTVVINRYSTIKYENEKKVIVTNLATQHDPVTEFLLREISEKIISDNELTDIAYDKTQDQEVLEYLVRNFFNTSAWSRYDFQCVVCSDTSQLMVVGQQRQEMPSCISYFNRMITEKGSKLARSEFWYIDRLGNGLASYLGWFLKERAGKEPVYIFIELWVNPLSEDVGLGYPGLLLDSRNISIGMNLKDYSHAKYNNNRRISQFGTYQYNLAGDIFQTNKSDYHVVYADGLEHLVYRPDQNNIVVLSSHSMKWYDRLINFSYIFFFYFVVVSFCLLFFYLPAKKRVIQWNFKNKIQYTMIAMLLVSFAIIGIGTVYYINRQYLNKHQDIITEKMKSIHAELQDIIAVEGGINRMLESGENGVITDWLISLSERFFIDINLYDVDGQLIATSRPEVFEKGLVGRQINPEAFIQLEFDRKASVIERESIGKLSYMSAFEPFVNIDNRVTAFLNLPYFTQQDSLTEEISNVIVAIMNFYLFITVLAIIISVVVSNQITHPLNLLQDKFRNIQLGEPNEPIRYDSNDEIGQLVREYNRAIEELAWSANRLARSERESAWREMAKQIAHEINNPLTPMKLSVQHLKRAWDNQSERFDEYMEKISQSLVDQIDNLSSIATEFSNFAKMPTPQNQKIDIITKINNVVPLFAVGENKRAFYVDFHGLEHAEVYADKEQISRVFINLFKNALQAIPKERKTEIHVDVLKRNRKIWIRVKDNGLGIPEDMQKKIFRPNFTTKSSGMGLGLAIVRNIIENSGGTITFKTKSGKGTSFVFWLPEVRDNK